MSEALHDPDARGFASDNHSGAHPEVMTAVHQANGGHQPAYGADAYTARLAELIKDHFGDQAVGYPVFNGTGANLVGLQAITPRWGSVICPGSAHINTDEAGAAERVAGIKLITVDTADGKLSVDDLARHTPEPDDAHHPLPTGVSITQASEFGTAYSAAEIAELTEYAHWLGLTVHMDGARLANAAAGQGRSLRELTTDAGVDVVSFGGTKNGLLFGEIVVVCNREAVTETDRLRKISMQLASKMRFVSAQFVALLEGDLWLRSAGHANQMAARLSDAIKQRTNVATQRADGGTKRADRGPLPDVSLTQPTQANIVLATVPPPVANRLRQHVAFHDWNPDIDEVRWVCSFDTTQTDVDELLGALDDAVAAEDLL
jgi:threonine aldolase